MVHWEASVSNSLVEGQNELEESSELDIPDPMALDPMEELSRQDLAVLLDRELGSLWQETRALVELHYLAELPQDETAARIGVTPSALKARLHRARHQLRQVLGSELRGDVVEFGLTLGQESAAGWRETRIWCWSCGRHRMQAIFEPLPNGRIDFRLHCPGCTPSSIGLVNSGGYPSLDGIRTVRPALKRIMLAIRDFAAGLSSDRQVCPICRMPGQIRIMNMEEFASVCPFQICPSKPGFTIVLSF